MSFNEHTKLGRIWLNPEGKALIQAELPDIANSPFFMLLKNRTLSQLASVPDGDDWRGGKLERILAKLSAIPGDAEPPAREVPPAVYGDGTEGPDFTGLSAPDKANKWEVFELALRGPTVGNPFVDAVLVAAFTLEDRTVECRGFYDGDGVYRIRFMPDQEGTWTYRIRSNARSMDGIQGQFDCLPPLPDHHGPVRVKNTFHFAYEDGTRYIPVGTTCYAWTHQGDGLEEETLETLKRGPFNKLRMCVFPKSYLYNSNEPVSFPYEGTVEKGWDFKRFNPAFFRHLEMRIEELGKLGIEADLILFHAYDRWGFSEMSAVDDDRYLSYLTARLSAYRNVWWSLANEYDLMWAKEEEDWERFAALISRQDPVRHLMSVHNCFAFYDYSRPWVTHCSIQRVDVYRTSENTDEWRRQWGKPVVIDECAYEGNIDAVWGNITGEEMVRRFWEGTVRGGYVGHGETYVHPEDVLWWSKGGKLYGSSPDRIAFLRRVLEEGPEEGLNPFPPDFEVPRAGVPGRYYLYYFGFSQPRFRSFQLEHGVRYRADVIDTWNMTIEEQDGVYEGTFTLQLPGRPYIAVRLQRLEQDGLPEA